MKELLIPLTFAVLPGIACGQTPDKNKLTGEKERFSYAVGVDVGKSIQNLGAELDSQLIIKGIQDQLSNKGTLLSEKEVNEIKVEYGKKLQQQQEAKMAEQAKTNAEEGKAFLEKNKTQPGVKTTASGLQYQVISQGTGAKPKPASTVTVHYRGTTIDGREFDSSYGRGEPTTFPLNRVIPGWTEGVQLMQVGSKYKFFIPSALAYGTRGAPPQIGPNETLIFEVELLSISDGK